MLLQGYRHGTRNAADDDSIVWQLSDVRIEDFWAIIIIDDQEANDLDMENKDAFGRGYALSYENLFLLKEHWSIVKWHCCMTCLSDITWVALMLLR